MQAEDTTRGTDTLSPPDKLQRFALLLCALLILGGLYLRIQALGDPPGLSWDEHHFVKNAFNYLAGKADWNDHPPLGKLLMAWSIAIFGNSSAAFRLPSLLLGIGSIAMGGWLAQRLFSLPAVGPITAAFFGVDGFFIAYSRTALLDGMLTFCVLATTLLAVRARSFVDMLAASAMAGVAVSVKTSGLLAAVPIVYFCLREARLLWLLALTAMPLVFYAQWAYGLFLMGKPYGPLDALELQAALMEHHARLTEMKHPLTSRWYTWLVPMRTIALRFSADPSGQVRVMNSMGHPLLWWTTSLMVVGLSLRLFLRGAAQELSSSVQGAVHGFFSFHRPLTEALLMWWLFMAPWILTRRDSYIYHYLPAYAFGLIVSGAGCAYLLQRRPKLALAALGVVGAVFLFYAPVWGQLAIPRDTLNHRLLLPGWR